MVFVTLVLLCVSPGREGKSTNDRFQHKATVFNLLVFIYAHSVFKNLNSAKSSIKWPVGLCV